MTLSSLFGFSNGQSSRDSFAVSGSGEKIDLSEVPSDVRRLLRENRYMQVLCPKQGVKFDPQSTKCAWDAMQSNMAAVPAGNVWLSVLVAQQEDELIVGPSEPEVTQVGEFFLDRLCVTNAQYAQFLSGDGYRDQQWWPEAIHAAICQFVDQTGQPGPRFWQDGQPPKDALDHPVVGISWYEANAYAKWVGKFLPTSAQWQRAATWGHSTGDRPAEAKYPWGNVFDPSKANLWSDENDSSIAVDWLASGDTPNGIRQLIGNVWEWIANEFEVFGYNDLQVQDNGPVAEIRGAAFDTYLRSQATCQFRSGKALNCRAHNIGFRCCRQASDIPSQVA